MVLGPGGLQDKDHESEYMYVMSQIPNLESAETGETWQCQEVDWEVGNTEAQDMILCKVSTLKPCF
jgi:hypothetical protein